jgi:hypothetical protein
MLVEGCVSDFVTIAIQKITLDYAVVQKMVALPVF